MLTARIDQSTGAVHVIDEESDELVAIGRWPAGWHLIQSTSPATRQTLAAEGARKPLFTLNLMPVES